MPFKDTWDEVCANCGKTFEQTQLGGLSDAICNHKPACSYECNFALGQVIPGKMSMQRTLQRTLETPMEDSPEGCAEQAGILESDGKFREAAKMWERARGASVGHNRRDRYEECRKKCEQAALDNSEVLMGAIRITGENARLEAPGRVWTMDVFGMVDPRGDHLEVIKSVNFILKSAGRTLRFVPIDCGDDHFYFGIADPGAENASAPILDSKGRIKW